LGYKYKIRTDYDKLVLKASELEDSTKNIVVQDKTIINTISESKKEKLYSYVSKAINKELSIESLLNNSKGIPNISNKYIVFLSRDNSCQKEFLVRDYLEKNDGVKLVNSLHGDVYYFESKQNHESVDSFVNEELMILINNDCSQLIFVVQITPTCYYKAINKELNTFDRNYVNISKNIDEKLYDDLLIELINISGKPIYELIEKAPLDFFSDQVFLDETKILRNRSDSIFNILAKPDSSSISNTELLFKLGEENLTQVLVDICQFNFDRAKVISCSILKNIDVWRKVLYGE
jgi:hypothetical protein